MKHLIKKFTYAGAKKGNKPPPPKPPVLKPPRVGSYKVGSSYQFSEAVDLICQGPIDGLCNRFGSRLSNSQLLQGIYLNDVPIEQSVSSEKIQFNPESVFEGGGGLFDVVGQAKEVALVVNSNNQNPRNQNFWRTNMSVVYNIAGKYNTKYYTNYSFAKNVLGEAGFSWSNSVPMSYWYQGNLKNYYRGKLQSSQSMGTRAYGDQRFTKPAIDGGSYEWPEYWGARFYLDSYPYRAKIDGSVDSELQFEYSPSWSTIDREMFRTYDYLYNQGRCVYPYNQGDCTSRYQEQAVDYKTSSVCRRGLNELVNISDNRTNNPFEWEYLKKKLKGYGIALSGGDVLEHSSFINQIKEKFGRGTSIETAYWNTPSKNIAKPYIAFRYTWDHILDGFTEANEFEFTNEIDGKPLERELDFVIGDDFDGTYEWYSRDQNTVNMLIPVLDKNTGKWNGKVRGFYLNFIATEIKTRVGTIYTDYINSSSEVRVSGTLKSFGMLKSEVEFYRNITHLGIYKMPNATTQGLTKYNFLNVLAEFRNGEGPKKQTPLSYFKDVYLDRPINKRLVGPFNIDPTRRMQSMRNFDADGIYKDSNKQPRQRSLIVAEKNSRSNADGRVGIPAYNTIPEMAINPDTGQRDFLLALDEGSSDKRPSYVQNVGDKLFEFSEWNSFRQDYNEKAQPVSHVIYNPDVESCYVTINIEGLWDTLHHDESTTQTKILGSKLPGIVNFRVEVGYIAPLGDSRKGQFVKAYDRFFRVISLIEGGAGLDIGNPDNLGQEKKLSYVKELYKDTNNTNQAESEYTGSLIQPFELPPARFSNEYGYEEIYRERYIKITKLSTEGNSTLIQKTINMGKVTEIVPRTLNYPFSALVATKVDSRSFGEIPKRTYDVRMRKVKVPSNYTPLNPGGTDKRFWENATDLENAGKTVTTRIYDGDWDGTFKYAWTDNPAWILYDMLTDSTIGLGDLIKEENVNKWQLYKIGRWCDAVDPLGYFVGVSDNIIQKVGGVGQDKGGRQPRYSCNTFFQRGIKIFDALNLVAGNFRGLLYFSDSVVSFADDRIKDPIMTFTNDNVVEGIFNYSSYLKDDSWNALEVAYNDSEDNFEAKIEYIENEEDIKERGLIKNRVDAFGATSKAQARRFGEHLLYQSVNENEQVSFSTGLEGILIRPGDLIIIEDELKSLTSNFGKVLNTDKDEGTIRISDIYDDENFEGYLTVYIPTGSQVPEDIENILTLDRSRHDFITMKSLGDVFDSKKLDGLYYFDTYTDGFLDKKQNGDQTSGIKDEYASYTGENDGTKHFLWYSVDYTGWVFSTGKAFTNDPTYDKYISANSGETNGEYVTSFYTFDDDNLNINWYQFIDAGDGRNGSPIDLSARWFDLRETQGAVIDDDIKINETSQIQEIKIASGVSMSENDQGAASIGAKLYVDQTDLSSIYLPLIPKGSIYRFKRKDTNDRIYKVSTINEDDTHSYEVIASSYKSGKFRQIEETNFRDLATYTEPYKDDYTIDQGTYFTLPIPRSLAWETVNISVLGGVSSKTIAGTWDKVSNATGYRVGIRPAFDLEWTYFETPETSFDFNDIRINGQYRLYFQSLGASFDNNDFYKHYLDSNVWYGTIDVKDLSEDTDSESAVINGFNIN